MSTELANPVASGAVVAMPKSEDLVKSTYGDDAFDDLATIGNYLPRLQLCGSNSKPCKQGLIPIGHHALFKGKALIDMGKNVQAWICGWRPMALLTSGEKPVAFFHPESDGFKQIRTLSAEGGQNGALCGPQFLLFIPGQGFTTYFMSSKTAKNEAPNFKALIDKCAVIGAKFIENKKFSWHGPTVVPSSQQFATPDIEEYTTVLNEFKNPPESSVELADAAPGEAPREM